MNYLGLMAAALAVVCAMALLTFAPQRASAQSGASPGFSAPAFDLALLVQWPRTSQSHSSTSRPAWFEEAPSAKRYILLGAGIGAGVGAVFGLTLTSGESWVPPALAISVPAIVGAGTGALVGYLVYRARR